MMDRRPRYPMGVWSVVAATALSNGAFFVMFPLLPVHMSGSLGFGAGIIGVILGIRVLLEQGVAPIGGTLADRIGYRNTMLGGLFLRVIGLGSLAFATDVPGVLLSVAIAGLGGSLFNPSSRAVVAQLVPPRGQQGAYAVLTSAIWAAQCFGPFIGALLFSFSFGWISIAAGAALLLAMIPTFLLLPQDLRAVKQKEGFYGALALPMRDRDYRLYLLPHLLSWWIAIQHTAIMPLLAARLGGPQAVGIVFGVQAGFSVLLQIPLVRYASRHLAPLHMVAVSGVVSAVALVGYATATSVPHLALFSILMGVTQLLVLPGQAYIVARFAGPRQGAYFGTAGVAQGIGGSVGTATGGVLWQVGEVGGMPWLVWIAMAAIGLIAAAGYYALGRNARIHTRLDHRSVPTAEAVPAP